jgi:hypothetical protein
MKLQMKRVIKSGKGFSLAEVIIAVSLWSTVLSFIFFGIISITKLDIKTNKSIFNTFEKVNENSEKYYINPGKNE